MQRTGKSQKTKLLNKMLDIFIKAGWKKIKIWTIAVLIFTNTSVSGGESVVVLFVIDGLQRDAAEVAAANGASNLRFLIENGVYVKEAYCTSPAPRMFLPDGSLPWGTSSSPNVAMHTGTHVFESRQMDDIFLSARRAKIKSVFAGGAVNYEEFTTPDFCYAGSLSDSMVVQHGINHLKKDGVRLIRLHLQRIRDRWTGPEDKLDPASEYQKAVIKCDHLLGKLIEALRSENVWKESYIIVAGDHGMGITSQSDHPPSVYSSWLTFMNFYGPGIRKGENIPYAESPDLAIMVNYLLRLEPLKGHIDPSVPEATGGVTGTLLTNIFEDKSRMLKHPQMIRRYLKQEP